MGNSDAYLTIFIGRELHIVYSCNTLNNTMKHEKLVNYL